MGARDEQVIAGLPDGAVDPANQLRKELAVNVGQQHAERVGAARDEAAGGTVGGVAERFDRGLDPRARLLEDRALAVEDAGDGGDGHASAPRDVFHRHAHLELGIPRRPLFV